ncbi:GntR family transcriptional regulator [Thalassospira sp. MA62]|nr:GntR family transcriptional regulator [Thalassospira sp. MA62]
MSEKNPVPQDDTGKPKRNSGDLLRKRAYERIEDFLNSGRLHPGQVVSQRELVNLTGATLGAVREAVSRLEAEGLLQTLPQRGLMVPSLDIAFVRDAYQLRRMIELEAIRFARTNMSRDQVAFWIAKHGEFQTRISDNLNDDIADEMQAFDWKMHEDIVGSMRNALIDNVYRVAAIKTRMVVQSLIRVTPYNADRVVAEHMAFLQPLHDGDYDGACMAMGRHIDNSLNLALGRSL